MRIVQRNSQHATPLYSDTDYGMPRSPFTWMYIVRSTTMRASRPALRRHLSTNPSTVALSRIYSIPLRFHSYGRQNQCGTGARGVKRLI